MLRKYTLFCMLMLLGLGMQAQTTLNLSLQECRDRALEVDESLKKMSNQERQAQLDKQVAFTNYLPDISGTLMTLYQTPSTETMGMQMIMHGMYSAGITLQETLYAGGRIKAGNDMADIARDIAAENLRKSRQQVLLDVDNAYWSLVSVNSKVEMLEAYKSYMDALRKRVQVSVEAELAVANDLMRIDAKASEIEYNLQKARTGQELCNLMLCSYTGIDFDTQIIPQDRNLSVESPTGLSEDISDLPEVAMLEKAVEISKKQVKLTRGEFLPSVLGVASFSASGNMKMKGVTMVDGESYSYSQNIKRNSALFGVVVSVPIFHWGEGVKKVRKAKLDVENAQLDLQKNKRLLSIQARSAIRNVQDGYLQIETAQKGADQAKESLRIMNERYDASLSTLTDLLDAQSQWSQAESNLIEAKAQYRIYQTEYLKATGRLE